LFAVRTYDSVEFFSLLRSVLMRSRSIQVIFACALCFGFVSPAVRGQQSVYMPTQMIPIAFPARPMALFPTVQPIKAAPFSGSYAAESKQVLTDGTTIATTQNGRVARDGEGRTYYQTTTTRGPSSGSRSFTFINIQDPVSGTQIMLLPETHTARKYERTQPMTADSGAVKANSITAGATTGRLRAPLAKSTSPGVQKEDLGVESIEGIPVRHYRETQTVPVGDVGNDRGLTIVSEFWYSKERRLNLKSTRTDPRSCEETITLSDISRAEPPLAMFEVPADYTVVESNMGLTGVTSAIPVSAVAPAAPSANP
jgi:hypothetical protein